MGDEEIIEVISALKANDKTMKDNGISDNLWGKAVECIMFLQSENAALCERLSRAAELPVKVGDTVYFIPTYNGNPIWGVQKGIVQMVGITRHGYHVKIRDRADFNKTYMFGKSAFLSKEAAEARLAELKGGNKDE